MATVMDIFDLAKTLSESDRVKITDLIANTITRNKNKNKVLTEKRFTEGIFCPRCNNSHIKRNGHKGTVQRYLCMDCHKTFTIATNTILASTKKDLSVWKKYIECMMNGYSIRKSAKICGMNKDTALVWRHKILDTLQNMADSVKLNRIIEGDETFFPISYKGNRYKSVFIMPRESHHRGKQTHIRGLSHEKVCVPYAVNRNGLSIAKITNLGRVSTEDLNRLYKDRIEEKSILCNDDMNFHIQFADKNNLELIPLKSGKSKKGIYHIQHINSYHSNLKKFMRRFNGVSTKY